MTLEPWTKSIRHVTQTARSLSDAYPVLSRSGSSHNGPAKSHTEMRREALDKQLACEGTVSCDWCDDFSLTGPFSEGIRLAAEHRAAVHAGRVVRTKRSRGGYRIAVKDAA